MVPGKQRYKAQTQEMLQEVTLWVIFVCLFVFPADIKTHILLRHSIILSALTEILKHHFETVTLKDNV